MVVFSLADNYTAEGIFRGLAAARVLYRVIAGAHGEILSILRLSSLTVVGNESKGPNINIYF